MELKKLTGPQAGSLKYDLLTALTATGLHGSPTLQTSLARLTLLVTARYNWRLDEVSIGQAELSRLWAVDLRTVKREMKRLVEGRWLSCLRAGVRGRVGAYRLNYGAIYQTTRPSWPAVGPDFVERMQDMSGGSRIVQVDFTAERPVAVAAASGAPGSWQAICARLCIADQGLFDSWFAKLDYLGQDDHILRLKAPNRFVARYIETHLTAKLNAAVAQEFLACDRPAPRLHLSSDA